MSVCIEKKYQVAVVGGGLSGVVAAIASARTGAKTVLVHDRGVLGGNCSSEVKVHIIGASCNWKKSNAVETGILMELLLENKKNNPNHNFHTWDGVLSDFVKKTDNLDTYMNTTMLDCASEQNNIVSIDCYQMSTESRLRIYSDIFIDATGDGFLGYSAGAAFRTGHEAKNEFDEQHAPNNPDELLMGASVSFEAVDVGHKVEFIKPDWAYTFTEEDFAYRPHGSVVLRDCNGRITSRIDCSSGYWWIELGGDWANLIKQAEDIRWELYKVVYGVWDHIKNTGDHGAGNYELKWVGHVAGRRDSRRLEGPYLLNENDVVSNRIFDDAVAYGGFWVDDHPAGGWNAKNCKPSDSFHYDGVYTIPYRCYYSKNIVNLMMAGRDISATKMGMSSSRVMGTCAVGGQAAGTAAALCSLQKKYPSELDVKVLQTELMKDDAYIPGFKYEDERNLLSAAEVSASSFVGNARPSNVVNGLSRNSETMQNSWESDGVSSEGEFVSLKLKEAVFLKELRLVFDPNLSEERFITTSAQHRERMRKSTDPELVKDYEIRLMKDGETVWRKSVENNYQRMNIIAVDGSFEVDEVVLVVKKTNGYENAVVFEIRGY